jgi:hypothetical protein
MKEFNRLKIAAPRAPLQPSVLPEYVEPGVKMIGEVFPAIENKITTLWGSAALQGYLYSIIVDNRGGRRGFPKQIITVLLRIHRYHGKVVSEDHRNAWIHASY